MQSNIFAKVEPLVKEMKLSLDCDNFIEFLNQHYRSGKWIYPSALHRSLKVNIVDIYKVLEACEDVGLVQKYLQIYCPYCQRFTGNSYKTIFDIPEEISCVNCDNEIQKPSEHAIIIYKVL